MTGRLASHVLRRLAAVLAASAAGFALVAAQPGALRAQGRPEAPATSAKPGKARPAPVRTSSQPAWNALSPAQKEALAPLAGAWDSLGAGHRRKWVALSRNYPDLPPQEQQRLHARMAEWAALSPQQRSQARLNFAETRKLTADDKKARWEAYQALPPEEKRRLAAGAKAAKPPAPPTAAAVRPVPAQKLARVPKQKKADGKAGSAALRAPVDQHTLLPQPAAPVEAP